MSVDARYEPSAGYRPSAIHALQIGSFRGEAKYEATPSRFEQNGGDSYELRMPVELFLREAFRAEIARRRIVHAEDARRVDGEIVEFDFPWVEHIVSPDRARCRMRFRFAVRDGDQLVFEKTYEKFLELGEVRSFAWGKPQKRDLGQVFVRLLRKSFSAFLDDCGAIAWLAAFGDPGPGCQWRSKPSGW